MADRAKRIHVLPDHVKSKIAAGEVIEGPFSVVKELLENSIDAGATEIEVHVFESGLKKILVRDNGCGIHPPDVGLAVREHATSKIADIEDIERISSYGFRGEALSSISSVAEVTLLTRPPDEDMGARLEVSAAGTTTGAYAGPAGTTVIVENLFYSVPARKKFLKSPKTEGRLIREVFLKTALVNPSISFALESDGKRVVTLGQEQGLAGRIARIYGNEISEGLYEETLSDIKIKIAAYLSKPDCLRASRNMQVLYINGRPVEYRYFSFLLSRAYEAVALPGRYPAAFVFIEIDPALVDVNIHPAKREVKLFDQRYIDSLILAVAEKALNREHAIDAAVFRPAETVPMRREADAGAIRQEWPGTLRSNGAYPSAPELVSGHASGANGPSVGDGLLRDGASIAGVYRKTAVEDTAFLGVAFGTYLVVEDDDCLLFIDFHAAHERIIYDSLLDEKSPHETQELLFPKIIEFPLADFHSILENLDVFLKIGFDIEEFSDNSIIIRGLPAPVKEKDIEKMFSDFMDSLKAGRAHEVPVRARAAASVACHAAKRAGDELTGEDIRTLLGLLKTSSRELRCPHGRPFVYRLTKGDLERLFRRS